MSDIEKPEWTDAPGIAAIRVRSSKQVKSVQ